MKTSVFLLVRETGFWPRDLARRLGMSGAGVGYAVERGGGITYTQKSTIMVLNRNISRGYIFY